MRSDVCITNESRGILSKTSTGCYLCRYSNRMFFMAESNYGVTTKIIPIDFNNHDCYDDIEGILSGLEIGVLGL